MLEDVERLAAQFTFLGSGDTVQLRVFTRTQTTRPVQQQKDAYLGGKQSVVVSVPRRARATRGETAIQKLHFMAIATRGPLRSCTPRAMRRASVLAPAAAVTPYSPPTL
mmetsp:Transcript_6961/g.21805  ORF Transcript_6961/g.21805 Transcript_6961/m.21805 type:complete len:109 (-) Transcript_6961:1430-1756(-)